MNPSLIDLLAKPPWQACLDSTEVVNLTYYVAYLLDSMEVFTDLSNHSGKLVLMAWKLSSFSFVRSRSKLNLQLLDIIITVKRVQGGTDKNMSSSHRCTSETLSRKGPLCKHAWDGDIGWSRSLQRAKKKSGGLQTRSHNNRILLKNFTTDSLKEALIPFKNGFPFHLW